MNYEFIVGDTEATRNKIYHARLLSWSEKKCAIAYMLNQEWSGIKGKDIFDDGSVLGCLCENKKNKIIASCRATPLIDGRYEISDALPDDIRITLPPASTVQINRLVIDKEHRNTGIYLELFLNLSDWILSNTPYSTYFAVCNSASVRMYQRIGASNLFSDGFHLKGRGDQKYFIVHGSVFDFKTQVHNITKNNHHDYSITKNKVRQPSYFTRGS